MLLLMIDSAGYEAMAYVVKQGISLASSCQDILAQAWFTAVLEGSSTSDMTLELNLCEAVCIGCLLQNPPWLTARSVHLDRCISIYLGVQLVLGQL